MARSLATLNALEPDEHGARELAACSPIFAHLRDERFARILLPPGVF